MLDIVADYHRTLFQGKLKTQIQANDDKPHFGLDLDPLDPNSNGQFFFQKSSFVGH